MHFMYIYILCTYIAADDRSSLHVVHSLRGSGDPGGEDLQWIRISNRLESKNYRLDLIDERIYIYMYYMFIYFVRFLR